jgi:ketosteroid isomerase-like protein
MSQENVEIVRELVAAMNIGDVDEAVRLSTEDAVLIAARSAVEGPFLGHEGLRKFYADNAENFELFQVRLNEVRAVDDDRLLAFGTLHIRGRAGEVETDIPVAGVFTFRGGKVSRWEDFRERALALKAVGLSE